MICQNCKPIPLAPQGERRVLRRACYVCFPVTSRQGAYLYTLSAARAGQIDLLFSMKGQRRERQPKALNRDCSRRVPDSMVGVDGSRCTGLGSILLA